MGNNQHMGYNSNCNFQNCQYDCCNFAGNPALPSGCYYYYHNSLSPGAIVGIVLGALVFIFLVILTIYCCKRCYDRHYARPPPPPVVSNEVMVMADRPPYQPYRPGPAGYY